jgi:hypothetical protein
MSDEVAAARSVPGSDGSSDTLGVLMDMGFSATDEAFRAEARDWL